MKTAQLIFSILLLFVSTSIVQAQQSIDEIDFVINSVKKMTSAQRAEGTKLFDKFELTKGMVLTKVFEHQTHHRGQTTVYLRLAKVTPPNEKLF